MMVEGLAEVLFDGLDRQAWRADAACLTEPHGLFFPGRGENATEARRICAACPVRAECLDYAMHPPNAPFGVWGGLTKSERRDRRRGRQARS